MRAKLLDIRALLHNALKVEDRLMIVSNSTPLSHVKRKLFAHALGLIAFPQNRTKTERLPFENPRLELSLVSDSLSELRDTITCNDQKYEKSSHSGIQEMKDQLEEYEAMIVELTGQITDLRRSRKESVETNLSQCKTDLLNIMNNAELSDLPYPHEVRID